MPFLIGSTGKRMLEITLPYADAWNAWYRQTGNMPQGVAPLRETVDAACRAAGRDPQEIERTVAVLIQMPDAAGRKDVYGSEEEVTPLPGNPDVIAKELRDYARQGIAHVQLVVEPMTEASLEALAPVLEKLAREG